MEAQKSTSRKRKQPSNSNPFAGILTRHKSQKFFFHHNRSGKSRKSRSFYNPNLPNNQRLPGFARKDVGVEDDDDEIYHISIKDLRARRVFSKPPKSEDGVDKNVNPKVDSELNDSKSVENGVQFDGKNPSLSVMEKCDSGVQLNGEGLNDGNPNPDLLISEKCVDSGGQIEVNPNLSVVEKCVEYKGECLNGENPNSLISEKCVDSGVDLKEGSNGGNPNSSILEKGVDYKGECLNGVNPNLPIEEPGTKDDMSPNLSGKNSKGLNGEQCEEDLLTTPPGAVVLVRCADSRSKRISPSKGGSAEGKKTFSNSRRNLVLNSCSRMKVYKPTNSFSYRRMLPFLMDLAKDTPSAPKVNQRIKIEANFEDNPVVYSSQESITDHPNVDDKPQDSALACETQEINTVSKEGELSLDSKTNDLNAQQAASCTPIDDLVVKSRESPSTDDQFRTPVSNYFKNEEESPDKQVLFSDTAKLNDTCPVHSPKRSPELLNDDATLDSPSHLSLVGDKQSRELVEFKSEARSPSVLHSPPKLESVVSADENRFGLASGILKKNPRGCRGICNCLNCASFRLNAKKAFEFSRNQLLDTEELVTDLMKELSNLRGVLNKSVAGADDNATVSVHQVQEISRRASNAEDIARSRLSQMNEDLHFHCRIRPLQRPRVAFSSSVNEKTVGRINLSR